MKNAFSTLNTVLSNQKNDDDCDLYGKLLASKMRQFNDLDKQELMYEIDGLILKKLRTMSGVPNVSTPSVFLGTTNNPVVTRSSNTLNLTRPVYRPLASTSTSTTNKEYQHPRIIITSNRPVTRKVPLFLPR